MDEKMSDDELIDMALECYISGYTGKPLVEQTRSLLDRRQRRDADAPNRELYRAAAIREYEHNDDVEFDREPLVSEGADPGAWVQGWIWVPDEHVVWPEQEEG